METLIFTLVVANRAILLGAPQLAARPMVAELVYLENLSFTPFAAPTEFSVETKNIATRKHDDRIFTLNQLTYTASNLGPQSLRMAFSFHEK